MMQLHRLIRRGRLAAAVLLSAAAAVTGAAAAAGPAQAVTRHSPFPAATPGWRLFAQFHPGPVTDDDNDQNVVAVGRDDAWAFGGTSTGGGTPLAQQWTGGQWQPVALPAGLTGAVGPASAPSAGNIWAAGQTGGYVLHWDGSAWSVAHQFTVEEPSVGQEITGITATGLDDVWVFGTSGAIAGVGAWHFDGQAWTQATGIAADVTKASALSARDIWGIGRAGSDPADPAAVMHWNGQAWSQVTVPLAAGAQLFGILALSPTSVWVSGDSGDDPLLMHFNGQAWSSVTVPFTAGLGQLTQDGARGLWILASVVDPTTLESTNSILHMSQAGAWTRHDFPATGAPSQVALIPDNGALWGAGFASTADGTNAGIFAFGNVRAAGH